MKVTYGSSAAESVVEAFGWKTDENNFIVDEDTNEPVESVSGRRVPLESMVGVLESINTEDTYALREDTDLRTVKVHDVYPDGSRSFWVSGDITPDERREIVDEMMMHFDVESYDKDSVICRAFVDDGDVLLFSA